MEFHKFLHTSIAEAMEPHQAAIKEPSEGQNNLKARVKKWLGSHRRLPESMRVIPQRIDSFFDEREGDADIYLRGASPDKEYLIIADYLPPVKMPNYEANRI